MSNTTASLRRKINSAGNLQSVVQTMKALAASSIGQYEQSVRALGDYYRAVELGLGICFRGTGSAAWTTEETRKTDAGAIGAIVFGSDQGLVGQFNDVVADHAVETLAAFPTRPEVWAVGERVHARLADAGLLPVGLFTVPNSVKAITPLVGQILMESETRHGRGELTQLHLFYNRPKSGAVYAAVRQRLLPLDEEWRRKLVEVPWVAAPQPCGHSSANTFSSRSSGRAPNPSRARTQAAWRQCNGPTRTSTNCWRISTGHSIVCAKVASTKNCSTSSPASKR